MIDIKLFLKLWQTLPTVATPDELSSPDLLAKHRIGHVSKPRSLVFGQYPVFILSCSCAGTYIMC